MKCPHCPHSNFQSEEDVAAHVLRYHRKRRHSLVQFKCSYCSRHFMLHSSFRHHKQTCIRPKERSINDGASTSHEADDLFSQQDSDVSFGGGDPQEAGMLVDADHEAAEEHDSIAEDEAAVRSDDELHEDVADLQLNSLEALQCQAATLLAHLKEECNTTQHVIKELISGFDDVHDTLLTVIQDKVREAAALNELISLEDTLKTIGNLKGCSIFEGVQDMNKYLMDVGGLVPPVKIPLLTEQELRAGKLVDHDTKRAYIIPFLPQLKRLLSCKDVLHCVKNPRKSSRNDLKTLLDGEVYRNHPVTQKDPNALGITLFVDAAEMVDPLGSRTGKHNTTFVFWTLANIYPEYRSTDRVVFLLAAVKTEDLATYGWEPILKDFKAALEQLASDEGVTFEISDVIHTVHGMLLCVVGDTPALANIGGFKESVSAFMPCRQCLAPKSTYLQETDCSKYERRTKESHEGHIALVESYKPKPSVSRLPSGQPADPSVRFGVNYRSELMSVPFFDVTTCLPQDIMHLGPEGVEGLVCKIVLHYVVIEKKLLPLDEVNKRIGVFSKYLNSDKPSNAIKVEHLTNGLRQSAAQMRNLGILLPFVLVKKNDQTWSFEGEEKYLTLLLKCVKLMNFAMCYEFKTADAFRLKRKVSEFHQHLLTLKPDLAMAKMHFFHHLSQDLLLFGPLRQHASFRFEGHFAFFKRIARIIRNYNQIILSVSTRHQTRLCHLMMQEKFLYHGHKFTEKFLVPASVSDPTIGKIREMFKDPVKIALTGPVKIHGTVYRKDSIILITSSTAPMGLPEFAKILEVYAICDSKFAFVCQGMETKALNNLLNAYEVALTGKKMVVDAETLQFPHAIIGVRSEGNWFAIPVGHRKLLT